jgi:hypothetical protein
MMTSPSPIPFIATQYRAFISRPQGSSLLRKTSVLIFLFFSLATSVSAQTPADFTGHWRRQAGSAIQRRLDIEQKGKNLRVKTVETNHEGTRNLEVKYEIGGPETTYTGLDGDKFHSAVRWDGKTLVFEITEHEGGSEIPQKVVWTLSDDSTTLQVDRSSTKSGQTRHSLIKYVREP